jgi:prepilin-type N-terminal cleavage/methylation domain-containing protein
MKKYTKGFTLIELLVVIAIIGILSSVVLVSLNTARAKGKDAKMQAEMSGLRSAAEIYYSSNGNSYDSLFTTNNTFDSANSDANKYLTAIEDGNGAGTETAGSSATAYAVSAQLPSSVGGTASYYCVDSTGTVKTGATALTAGDTVCP